MSIVKFAENYFVRLYQVHHAGRLKKDEKVKTALVVLSCFSLIVPGIFALIYGLSGLFGRGKQLKKSPKPVQQVAQKVELVVPKEAPPEPFLPKPLLALIPHLLFEGYKGKYYMKEILKFLEGGNKEESEALFRSATQFTNVHNPELFVDLLKTLRFSEDIDLAKKVCAAFGPVFLELPEQMLQASVSEILAVAQSCERCREQVHQSARVFNKLFKIPDQAADLQKILHNLFDYWITDEVVSLVEEQFEKPPTIETAWSILEGLCPKITNVQSAAREKNNFIFIMQSPEINQLELDSLHKQLYSRLVARNLFNIPKKDLPPLAVDLFQQFRDFPSARTLINYLDNYFAPTLDEYHEYFNQLRPYPAEHLQFVHQHVEDYLRPTYISERRNAALAALKVHKDELKELVSMCKELFFDDPQGFVLLASIPMPKRMQLCNLFKNDVLGNGLLADFPEKPTAYAVMKKLSEMDLESAKIALSKIAELFHAPIQSEMLAQLINVHAPACSTH